MYKFPDGFFWGAATSGVQSEGSTNQINQYGIIGLRKILNDLAKELDQI